MTKQNFFSTNLYTYRQLLFKVWGRWEGERQWLYPCDNCYQNNLCLIDNTGVKASVPNCCRWEDSFSFSLLSSHILVETKALAILVPLGAEGAGRLFLCWGTHSWVKSSLYRSETAQARGKWPYTLLALKRRVPKTWAFPAEHSISARLTWVCHAIHSQLQGLQIACRKTCNCIFNIPFCLKGAKQQ